MPATVSRVRVVAQAIADHLVSQGMKDKGVVIGYDTRFQSETFAVTAAEVMAGNGIVSYFTNRDCPTPVVSFAIRAGRRAVCPRAGGRSPAGDPPVT